MKKIIWIALVFVGLGGWYFGYYEPHHSLASRLAQHHNLASRLVKQYPELQAICDSVGGCQNVYIDCTRYDGNETFWSISTSTGSFSGIEVRGFGWTENDRLDTRAAIEQAISDYWGNKKSRETLKEEPETTRPNSTPCEKDCGL